MVECTLQLLLTTSASWWEPAYRFVLTNLTTVGILVLALVIVRRIFSEKRTPSNFFAWLLLIVFAPLLGVPLYLLFGGRKSSRITRIKRQVTAEARALTAPEASAQADHCVGTSAAPTHGNHFELLPDGEHGFARLCECIENAQHTIHMATFILSRYIQKRRCTRVYYVGGRRTDRDGRGAVLCPSVSVYSPLSTGR